MDEKEVPSSFMFISEDKIHSLYPMYFGVSCAFVALKLLLGSNLNDVRWLDARDRMLQGSAHLLGLLVWRIQRDVAADPKTLKRLEKAETEVAELKKRRSEDAKANEKVVSIFAAQEQGWFSERKKLRQQIGALLRELHVLERKKEEIILNLNEKIKEKDVMIQSRDKSLEESEMKRRELENMAQKAEAVVEELRETRKKEAEEHSSELWKHKTAFLELVSNHRQLESEMGRALRQVDAAKQELDSVLKQKEESALMVQKLSVEVVKVGKDAEQKDKILSAMLRKSKLDAMEKELMFKELKISKARRKQAEIETEKLKVFHESSRLEKQGNKMNSKNVVHVASENYDQCSPLGKEELVITTDVKQLEDWVQAETERHTAMIQQRHHLEIDAFSEQLRLKDEKLEAFRWRLLSSELELKRAESQIRGLNQNVLQLKEENTKLKTILSENETKLSSLQEKLISLQLKPQYSCLTHCNSLPKDLTIDPLTDCSNANNKKTKKKKKKAKETDYEEQDPSSNNPMGASATIQVPEDDIAVEKEVSIDIGQVEEQSVNVEEAERVAKPISTPENRFLMKKDTSWKVDLHALGVSYNIKRLKQQLVLLEKLVGMPENCGERRSDDAGNQGKFTNFHMLMPLLNRQVIRYQSLQEKIDDLCRRLREHDLDANIEKTKEETKTLESLLEETFQLQRFMVATGQKLMEMQSRLASGSFAAPDETERSANFDIRRFFDNARTLFKEVQRGLEVRIARVIGNLEGTLMASGRSFDSGMKR